MSQLIKNIFQSVASLPITKVNANYLITLNDYTIDAFENTFNLTLPDPITIIGRQYQLKNTGGGTITILTQTGLIDGAASQTITSGQAYILQSDGLNWLIIASFAITTGGGSAAGARYDVQFRGQTPGTFDASSKFYYDKSRESLTVGVAGTNLFNNPCSINGDIDDYLQSNVQNINPGVNSSSDIVATANNGNDNTNYIDLGINSQFYNNPAYSINGPNDGYLFSVGGNISLGTADTNTDILLHAGGTTASDEKLRIKASGCILQGINELAQGATMGFFNLRNINGAPTGTPVNFPGVSPIVIDSVNNAFYFYSGGQWRTVKNKKNDYYFDDTLKNTNSQNYVNINSLNLTGLGVGVNYILNINVSGSSTSVNGKAICRALFGNTEIGENVFNLGVVSSFGTASFLYQFTATQTTQTINLEAKISGGGVAQFTNFRINLIEQ